MPFLQSNWKCSAIFLNTGKYNENYAAFFQCSKLYTYLKNKEFNTIEYTTYIWSYKIKYDYFMTEQVV